jgi:hypothetical protein
MEQPDFPLQDVCFDPQLIVASAPVASEKSRQPNVAVPSHFEWLREHYARFGIDLERRTRCG